MAAQMSKQATMEDEEDAESIVPPEGAVGTDDADAAGLAVGVAPAG
jgi:hypothetical protein